MSDEPTTIDDLDLSRDAPYMGLIRCVECDDSGILYSTGPVEDLYVFGCETCEEDTVHEAVLSAEPEQIPE